MIKLGTVIITSNGMDCKTTSRKRQVGEPKIIIKLILNYKYCLECRGRAYRLHV
jgi:hypothetical protein